MTRRPSVLFPALVLVASCAHPGTPAAPSSAPPEVSTEAPPEVSTEAPPGVPETAASASVTPEAERDTFVGGAEWFTGKATVSMLFAPNGPRTFGGATVAFEPGARTAWHTHPAGQTLVVTEGNGWVQTEGEPRRDLKPGDVMWTPPGVRHWHGATATTAMTHIALQGQIDGSVVSWQEPVSDAQYLGAE